MNTLAICTDREDSVKDFNTAIKFLNIVDDVYPKLVEEADYIYSVVTRYQNATRMEYLEKNFPETKFLRKYYSSEAWKITEAIGNVLTKIKNFFKRVVSYIKVFVVVRIGAAEQVIKRWAAICENQEDKVKTFLEKLDEKNEKNISAKTLVGLLEVSAKLYKERQDQFAKIANLSVSASVSGDNAKELSEQVPAYNDWLKVNEEVEKQDPHNQQTHGSAAVNMTDGGWGDRYVISRLAKSVSQANVAMRDLNAMQRIADKLISDLSTDSNTPTTPGGPNASDANAKVSAEGALNNAKLGCLKTFVKQLQTMVGTFVAKTSFAGKMCTSFCKQFGKVEDKAARAVEA